MQIVLKVRVTKHDLSLLGSNKRLHIFNFVGRILDQLEEARVLIEERLPFTSTLLTLFYHSVEHLFELSCAIVLL